MGLGVGQLPEAWFRLYRSLLFFQSNIHWKGFKHLTDFLRKYLRSTVSPHKQAGLQVCFLDQIHCGRFPHEDVFQPSPSDLVGGAPARCSEKNGWRLTRSIRLTFLCIFGIQSGKHENRVFKVASGRKTLQQRRDRQTAATQRGLDERDETCA